MVAQIRDGAPLRHQHAGAALKALGSIQDDGGIGPKRRQRAGRFGGLRGLSAASVGEIATVEGVSRKLAERIYAQLHGQPTE
jgi:excinuclease ABC subunit C